MECRICKYPNDKTGLFCVKCDTPLWNAEILLQKVCEKQIDIERRHKAELESLKSEINRMSAIVVNDEMEQVKEKKVAEPTKTVVEEPVVVRRQFQTLVAEEKIAPIPKKEVPKEPTKLELQIQSLLDPLHQGFSFFGKAYNKYKSEGKLPIFFMTIAGLIAILFGVGYLMQNSFQYMGIYADVVKVGSGFLSAFVAGGLGFRMYKKDKKFHEFGAALLSLGIILNYLMIYFLSDLGNFPLLSSAMVGFTLIIANTAVAIIIALRFETKIVSVLSLLGGAVAPFYLNATSDGSFYYLYLWILVAASCYVGFRIKWKTLQYLAFTVALVLLEFTLFNKVPSRAIFTGYYHLFAYLFFYVILFEKTKIKNDLEKMDLVILATNVSLLLMNLYFTFVDDLLTLGLILLGNVVLVSFPLMKKWSVLPKKIKFVFFVVIGSLLGLAVPSLFGQVLMGLFWSVEAIGLILIGFVFALPSVRKEGYFVLLVALLKLAYSSTLIVVNWGEGLLNEGFLNFITLGGVITSLWFFSARFKTQFTSFETQLFAVFKEVTPVWLASIFMIVGYHTIGVSVLTLTIIPMLGLIYWGKSFQTRSTSGIGISLLILYVLAFGISALQVGSYHFRDQEVYAQIALLELFVSLWGIQFFFDKIGFKKDVLYPFSHVLRVGFFMLIPLLVIYQTNKHFDEYLIVGVWVSVLVAFLLQKKLLYKPMIYEVAILFALGAVVPFYTNDLEWFSALSMLAVISVIFAVEKAHLEESFTESVYKSLLKIIPFLAIGVISFLVGSLTGDTGLAFCVYGTVSIITVLGRDKVAVFDYSKNISIRIAIITCYIGLALYPFTYNSDETNLSVIFAIACAYILGRLLKDKRTWFETPNRLTGWATILIFHQLMIIGIYTVGVDVVGLSVGGPYYSVLLILHAILLLFMALKNQNKLYNRGAIILFLATLIKVVLYDIRDFETTEKIIVFILMGVLLLGASFLYVKLKERFDKKIDPLPSGK